MPVPLLIAAIGALVALFLKDIVDFLKAPVDSFARAEATLILMREGALDPLMERTRVLADRIGNMGFRPFRSRWAYARQLMPLQGRLLIEQVLWAMGPPWRTLLTGFNPVELADVGVLVPFKTSYEETNVPEERPRRLPRRLIRAYLRPGSGGKGAGEARFR